ncbi:heat shock protein DnaJ domain protein [Magnetococcus marinus MC-1]|uniref:Heat shock protein DnaJ domain protein n=1 Tax=Magnetococcus marinus (strain ATCC BAA-1437 / JCM 17883 / MC-1) TaxID=156889 RepID=A0L866_MAGMM|nr:DnaJ C-terminal domain-containing protein [Magnetococcus marinus]ABK44159.1 heat shock protein DnaJ domain protein [Magnetococcus marinus MC-1]
MAMMEQDFYRRLNVPSSATPLQIRDAYRRLARQFHPDVSPIPQAEDLFKALGEAYEVLRDPQKRAQYDRTQGSYIWPNTRQSPPKSGTPAGKPHHVEAKLIVPLEVAYRGEIHQVRLNLRELGGDRLIQVQIPRGVVHGDRIRVYNQVRANPLKGISGGDILFNVETPPHPHFQLEGYDLYSSLTLSPWEAALGEPVQFKSLGGTIRVHIPAGSSSGQLIRIRGRGFPKPGFGQCGDLYLRLNIALPKQLNNAEKRLYRKLAKKSDFNPRGN